MMPRLSKLLKKTKALNSEFIIRPVPGPLQGVQQFITTCLNRKLGKRAKIIPTISTNLKVWVKVTGDGAKISCNINLVSFVIVEKNIISNSPNDHCTVALSNCKEKL